MSELLGLVAASKSCEELIEKEKSTLVHDNDTMSQVKKSCRLDALMDVQIAILRAQIAASKEIA